ncbi:MAG: InlB B-repeat-containing protein [Muribaculum sp.]|nr:InlB B-repeat-containing protein [Muribaculum sp.]
MKNTTNMSNRLTAVLLSAAMLLSPVLQSTPVYAAEAGWGILSETESPSDETAAADQTVGSGSDEAAFWGTQDGESIPSEYVSPLGTAVPLAVSDFSNVGGWNESIYAEIAGVKDADVTAVSYSGEMSGSLTGDDLTYLVRDSGDGVRIDIPGLRAGTYTLTVKVGANTLTKEGIKVYAYDRSGYAHFNDPNGGVGAYKNDGTLKDNAVILYVTDANKNSVSLTCGGITVRGIGNILNSVGQEASGGKTSNGGTANTNQGIIKALAKAGKPLVVRFVGTVSETEYDDNGVCDASKDGKIDGLTDYASVNNGGSKKDNGHMARIQSGKDVTLEGIGYDATIDGWGFHYIAEGSAPELGKSFEVRNLTFINTPEDAVGMEGQQSEDKTSATINSSVERCWVHHNEFYAPVIGSPAESDKSEGDGSVDFKRGQYFTCSYNYFEGCHKTNLVGASDKTIQYNISYHHNHWNRCKARGPLARNANIHMYNNVVDMQTDYAQNTRADAYIFSEYNLFYMCKSPQAVEGGAIKSYHDSIAGVIWNKGSAGTIVMDKSQYVPNNCQYQAAGIKYDKFDTDPALSYIPGNHYQLETDFTELRKVIASQTGTQARRPKQPADVTAGEYSVIAQRGAEVNDIDLAVKQTLAPGKMTKSAYAFRVGGAFNLEVSYSGEPGVLVNEAGENLLTGDGSVAELPEGTYMIHAVNFQPGDAKTLATFKDVTISSLTIEPVEEGKHYHKWVLDPSKCVAPTCVEEGMNYFTCAGTVGTCDQQSKQEAVSALGHSYGSWTVDKEATEEEPGQKSRRCIRCDSIDVAVIPAGSSGTGGNTGDQNITAAGDYILTFEGLQENDASNFFTVTGSYANSKGSTMVNGVKYEECLKMESKTKIGFSCNDGAKLFMAFASTESGKTVKVDGKNYTTGAGGTVTVELAGGSHEITKGDSINLFYLSVANGGTAAEVCTLSFEYNYEDAPEAMTRQVLEGTSYASPSALAPVSFTRSGYVLSGLYKDASCTQAVSYPYVVNGNATLYADWAEDDTEVVTTYRLIFNSNGGSAVATVWISTKQIYEITQRTTRAGYAFTGWYDALEGGNYIDKVDGSRMNGDFTVYAHWNAVDDVKHSLDVSKDFADYLNGKSEVNITEPTPVGGFTIHALAGGVGSEGQENPKYYMTVKADANNGDAMGLFTNGVRLTDKNIEGNEDGLLKTIEFTAGGPGILKAELALTKAPDQNKQYDLVLAKRAADGSLAEAGRISLKDIGKKRTAKTFEVNEAGTYYLYAEGERGVVYFNLNFTEHQYTVLYRIGAGTAEGSIEGGVFKEGDVVELPVCMPPAGYLFKGWTTDGGATRKEDSYTVSAEDALDGVILLEAVYEAIPYTLKYDANGGTLPAGTQESVTVTAGQNVTLGACTPAAGQKFTGWSIGGTGELITAVYTVNPADADQNNTITLKALYAAEGDQTVYYTVTLDTDGGTLVDGGGKERLIESGKTIDPGECEKSGYVFKYWSVNGEKVTMPYTVTQDVTLKAVYGVTGVFASKEGIHIIGLEKSYAYTGAKILPNIGVADYDIDNGKLLTQGVDYTVSYKNNTKPGDATVTVTGKGNYAGKDLSKTFQIVEVDTVTEGLLNLKSSKLAKIDAVTYTGEAQYPNFTLTLKDRTSTEYQYDPVSKCYKTAEGDPIAANVALSNNVNKGTATILITGEKDAKGNATKVKKTFKITAVDLSKNAEKLKVEVQPGVYAVKGAAPASITVTYDGRKLRNGTDYTAKYTLNKKVAGESAPAKITITGKGNYAKKYTGATYTIGQLDLAGLEIQAVKAYTNLKAGKVTATVLDKDGTALKASQYTLQVYKEDGTTLYDAGEKLAAGKIYVTAVAKDTVNLTGQTKRLEVTVGTNIAGAKAVLAKEGKKAITKTYTGKPVSLQASDLTVTIKLKDENKKPYTKTLVLGTDYVIASYTNNVKKGTATAVLMGINDYSGTKTVKFKIVGKPMQIVGEGTWNDAASLIQSFKEEAQRRRGF